MERTARGSGLRQRLLAGAAAVGALGAVGVLRLPATTARAASIGTIHELSADSSQAVYLFGLTGGPDGNLWFTNSGCMGIGHCTIASITPTGSVASFRRGLSSGSVPLAIAPGTESPRQLKNVASDGGWVH